MTEHAAAERIQLPKFMAAKLLPRRGVRLGPPLEDHPDAPERLAEHYETHAELLDEVLKYKQNQRHRDAIRAYLSGKPDPRGAAAAGELLRYVGPYRPDWWTLLETRAWIQAHGLPWAVRASLERSRLDLVGYYRYGGGSRVSKSGLQFSAEGDWLDAWKIARVLDRKVMTELRGRLAAASDDEYTAAVAAAAEHRGSLAGRFVAAFLFPDETDWVLQACKEYRDERQDGEGDRLLYHAVSSPSQLAAARIDQLMHGQIDAESVAALVDSLGAESLLFLTATLESGTHSKDSQKLLLRAIVALPVDEAAAYIVDHLDRPFAFETACDLLTRDPRRVLRAVAAAKPADAAMRGRLAALASRAEPADTELAAAERAAVDALGESVRSTPQADPDDLPALLVDPPWTAKRPKRRNAAFNSLEPVADMRLEPDEEADERHRTDTQEHREWEQQHPRWDDYLRDRTPGEPDWRLSEIVAYGPDDTAAALFPEWVEQGTDGYPGDVSSILARFGAAAIPTAVGHAPRYYGDFAPYLMRIFSIEAARFAADRLANRKTARAQAVAWLDRYGLEAAAALVPDALGKNRRRRIGAEAALLHLAERHGAAAVAAAAEPYGPEAVAAIKDLVDGDPLEPRGVTVPKLGVWASPLMFPQVLLKDGRALPDSSIPHLLTVLALATPEYRYAGIEVVGDICDRASLARFSRAVFEQWLAVGAPAKDGWAFAQLIHFADDLTIWALAEHVIKWPAENQHMRAVNGLEILGAIGTEEALRAVQTTAERAKQRAIKKAANEQIDRIATELGITREQLADRLVPDFGLADDAAHRYDYGPRSFTVAFDEHLKPFVVDDAGKPRKTLPKPAAKDDELVADESYKRFAAFRKELKTVATEQIRRLEQAMVAGRTWTAADFRECFADHALVKHLARRLVWMSDQNGTTTGFRIAEDGTFSDAADDAFDLHEGASVRLAHPALLGPESGTWAGLFADYEILQPFDQLARPVFAFTPDELATGRLTRFDGAKVEVGRVLGLTRRGWERTAVVTGGTVPGLLRALPGGGCMMLVLDPGFYAGDPTEDPEQRIAAVFTAPAETCDPLKATPPGLVDPVAASEALASLADLTRTA
jgi:hypothetical protein